MILGLETREVDGEGRDVYEVSCLVLPIDYASLEFVM